ncbi:MAG: hypothetical protein JW959_07505 [Pirellulales bacterium]|nr:hypothetical protein [Pirellulales bacterium]
MRKILALAVFMMMLGAFGGCRVAECWRYAWNSRFHPERNVIVEDPCVVVDPCCDPCCDPCGSSCASCGTNACGIPVTPAPVTP